MFVVSSWVTSIGMLLLLGFAICAAILTVLVKVSGKWREAFRCPDCGGAVDDALDTKGKPSAPILRLCPACDVLWQTGTTVAD